MPDQNKYNSKLKDQRVLIIGGSAGKDLDLAGKLRRSNKPQELAMELPKHHWRMELTL